MKKGKVLIPKAPFFADLVIRCFFCCLFHMSELFRVSQKPIIHLDGSSWSDIHRQTEQPNAVALQRVGFIFITAIYFNNALKQFSGVPNPRF